MPVKAIIMAFTAQIVVKLTRAHTHKIKINEAMYDICESSERLF